MPGWFAWSLLIDEAVKGQVHRPKWHRCGAQRVNQAANRLRFVLLRRRVSDHIMRWAWRKAKPLLCGGDAAYYYFVRNGITRN